MKAVILAAGMGKRLKVEHPKTLSKILNEKTLLDFQVSSLSKRIGVENIFVVVGYKKESIMKKFPQLTFVHNKAYQKTNAAKSLLLALKKIDDDVIWLASDVYFDDKVLDLIIQNKESCGLVDKKKCGEEEVKYDLDDDGYIKHLSKSLNGTHNGEALGVYLIKKNHLDAVREELANLDDNDYAVTGFEKLIAKNKIHLVPVYIGNLFSQDVDFQSDLDYVKKYLAHKLN